MNRSAKRTIASTTELYLVEDNVVETMDAQRQSEALQNIKAQDGKDASANGPEEVAAVSPVTKPDDFMESVKAFIRSIDINSL
jgi:hypothetical protein